MIEELRLRSRKFDIDHIEFGWVLEDNMGMRKPIEMSGAKIDKIHRIYEKRLAGAARASSEPGHGRGDVMNVISISATPPPTARMSSVAA